MSPPSVSELGRCCVVRGAPDVFISWGPNFASTVWSRSAPMSRPSVCELGRCREVAERPMSSPLGPELRKCHEVAEGSMCPPPGARTLRVPCGRGAPDVFTHLGPEHCGCCVVAERPMSLPPGGPNLAGTVRSRSARCLHRLCANSGDAVWSRSARCLHRLGGGAELCGFRAVAERSMSPPSVCPNLAGAVCVFAERSTSSPSGPRTL